MGSDQSLSAAPSPARVDLHCHTAASFDGVADPVAVVARAAERGLTHVAITDHGTLHGALRAKAAAQAATDSAHAAPHVIVGCEVLTREGDLIFVFLERPIPRGLSARDAIDAGREQGALVGIPHPYDPARRSLLLDPANEELVAKVDWVEAWNGRVGRRSANEQAAELARRHGTPAIGVSDAHALLEVGLSYTTMTGDPSTASGLLDALRGELAIVGADPAAEPGRLRRFLRPSNRHVGAAR